MIRGHPSPHGLDLVGAAFGIVPLDRDRRPASAIAPGDAVIGAAVERDPLERLHARAPGAARAGRPARSTTRRAELGRTLADELLEPTAIYVRAALELLRSEPSVHGLAHITGDGLLNLLRLNAARGYEIDAPLPPQPIFGLIAQPAACRTRRCGRCSTWAPASAA